MILDRKASSGLSDHVKNMKSDSSHTANTAEIRPPDSEELPIRFGFRTGDRGTHTSRTIMLAELRLLLTHCRPDATRADYISAIQEENCLGKRTAATRKASVQRLSELYALDSEIPLFRIMRRCWYAEQGGQALVAMLLALARDPLLRVTAPPVLRMQPGEELAGPELADAISRAVGGRLNDTTLHSVVRHAASSWTQSGHLTGRSRKIRQRVSPTAISVAYAVLLGYLAGTRGASLFSSIWSQVLDAPANELLNLARDARRLGLLDMSQSGDVIDVSVSRLLSQGERR